MKSIVTARADPLYPRDVELRRQMNRRMILALAASLILQPRDAWPGAAKHFKARLISGGRGGLLWRAGLDITLDNGWKTYWRMPGDAGVPPEFRWDLSRNVADVKVYWPAPARYIDAGGETVGYKDHVIFPLDVMLKDSAAPAMLALDLFFAVCEDICIPAETEAALVETSPEDAAALTTWLLQIAQTTTEAAKEGTALGIGGTPVSQAERVALQDLATALERINSP